METKKRRMNLGSSLFTCLLLVELILSLTVVADDHQTKMYIIYVGSHLPSDLSRKSFYDKMMIDVLGSDYSKNPSEYVLHTYERSFHGCVVKLTDAQAQQIAGVEGVVSVFPNEKMELHTTRSWDFMGFPINVPRSPIESDVIVGMIDTGIWPESPSFSDVGLAPVPAKWKGICQTAANFSCNKKIIGARFYKADKQQIPVKEGPTPRDYDGHGTHTASTVAGALIPNASFYGLGSGTARGGVPAARLAVYKVCWSDGFCDAADILAAFDDALADGVDVISMSIGGPATPYFRDPIAIGTFHAMQRGILASLSAGNSGPYRQTAGNIAPWLMSVAATTIDRKFLTNVQLGNGRLIRGKHTLNTFDLHGKKFPMIYGADAPNSSFPSEFASYCLSLNRTLVRGKIVVCDPVIRFEAVQVTLDAGAVGTVMRSPSQFIGDGSFSYPLPTTVVNLNHRDAILSYIRNLSRNPVGTILKSKARKDKLAPYVASFSSRGPNAITPTILKPDLSAPGVDIIAAYSPKAPVSSIVGDTRSVMYRFLSGTSMACPHASATAAYVKSYHPDWSPSAIRSALMTTASPLSPMINKDAELGYGAGHINPRRAIDPGLVYDASEVDYVNFLCDHGFSLTHIRQISRDKSTTCPKHLTGFVGDLNYPSITVATNSSSFKKIFRRRVTSVAKQPYPSVYEANVTSPKGVSVQVVPKTLRFTHPGQELSFTVHVKGRFGSLDEVISASIEWFDGVHKVRSPIVVVHL